MHLPPVSRVEQARARQRYLLTDSPAILSLQPVLPLPIVHPQWFSATAENHSHPHRLAHAVWFAKCGLPRLPLVMVQSVWSAVAAPAPTVALNPHAPLPLATNACSGATSPAAAAAAAASSSITEAATFFSAVRHVEGSPARGERGGDSARP